MADNSDAGASGAAADDAAVHDARVLDAATRDAAAALLHEAKKRKVDDSSGPAPEASAFHDAAAEYRKLLIEKIKKLPVRAVVSKEALAAFKKNHLEMMAYNAAAEAGDSQPQPPAGSSAGSSGAAGSSAAAGSPAAAGSSAGS